MRMEGHVCTLKDRTPDYVEPGETEEDFSIPLPEDDEELKKLFAMGRGMTVAHKGFTFDRTYALVDYVCCVCPVKDFSETAKLIPRMRSSVTEVSFTFCNMTL
jgi:hypothetical protein